MAERRDTNATEKSKFSPIFQGKIAIHIPNDGVSCWCNHSVVEITICNFNDYSGVIVIIEIA